MQVNCFSFDKYVSCCLTCFILNGELSSINRHFVSLQEDTISINHNWFNAYNLSWVVSGTCCLINLWEHAISHCLISLVLQTVSGVRISVIETSTMMGLYSDGNAPNSLPWGDPSFLFTLVNNEPLARIVHFASHK